MREIDRSLYPLYELPLRTRPFVTLAYRSVEQELDVVRSHSNHASLRFACQLLCRLSSTNIQHRRMVATSFDRCRHCRFANTNRQVVPGDKYPTRSESPWL